MMKKLFKWDLIYYFNQMKWMLIGTIFLGLTTYLFMILKESNVAVDYLYNTTLTFTVIGIVAIIVYAYFLVLRRYYTSVLKDEGYFTHTLPISKTKIILAKYLAGVLMFLLMFGVGLLFMFLLKIINWDELMMLNDLSKDMFGYLIFTVLLSFISFLVIILVIYAALSFGFSFNSKEWLYVFLFILIYYGATQILSAVNLGINLAFNPNLLTLEDPNQLLASLLPVLIVNAVISLGIGIACFLITKKYLTHKLNLKNG